LFGGFGGIGSTGIGGGGIRGGLIPGGGGFVAATGSINPFVDLETAFGGVITSESIAKAIRDQDAQIRAALSEGAQVVVDIATGPDLALVLNISRGLFEIFRLSDRAKVGGGPTPEAALEAVRSGSLREGGGTTFLPDAGFAEPSPIPGPAEAGDFGELLRTILGALGQLRGGRARPTGLEPVAIGGTVNVPVVPGSTSDPRGTLRPTEAAFLPKPPPPGPRSPPRPTAPQAAANIARVILSLLLQRQRERALRDAQRRQRELIAAAAALRRQQMPFGQSGASFIGPVAGGAIGGAIGGLAEDAIGALIERFFPRETTLPTLPQLPGFPSLPAFPPTLPQLPPGIPGLSGGAGVCPDLFRMGTGAMRVSPTPWFPVQAPDGKWFFFGHLGKPTFSKLKSPRRHHHHPRKR